MKKSHLVRLLLLTLLLVALTTSTAFAGNGSNFKAKLRGVNEVPPVTTKAKGHAHFKLSKDGLQLEYKLNVSNLENVVAAHIHIGVEGTNGPVVAFLYGPASPGGGNYSGPLAQGVITETELVGPLAGQPLSALIDLIRNGEAYVNVHTNDGVDPPNTGPGDIASGEIRGQIH